MLSVFDYFCALTYSPILPFFTKLPTYITPAPCLLVPSLNINNVSTEKTYESGETLALPSLGFKNGE